MIDERCCLATLFGDEKADTIDDERERGAQQGVGIMNQSDELLTVDDVAARLRVTPWYVNYLVRQRELQVVLLSAKKRRFRAEDVNAFIEGCVA